jgi:hypothetical protein
MFFISYDYVHDFYNGSYGDRRILVDLAYAWIVNHRRSIQSSLFKRLIVGEDIDGFHINRLT